MKKKIINLNGIDYTVRATTDAGIKSAIKDLKTQVKGMTGVTGKPKKKKDNDAI